MSKQHDYRKEALSLLGELKTQGLPCISVNDGGESIDVKACPAIDTIMSVDECWLTLQWWKTGRKVSVFVLLGNGPGEIVADWGIPEDTPEAARALDKAMTTHSNRWE